MSYLYDKRKKAKKHKVFVFALCIIVLLFSPILTYIYDVLEKPFARAHENVHNGGKHLSLLLDSTRFSKKQLLSHNQALQQEIKRLVAEQEYAQFFIQREEDMLNQMDLVYADILDRSLLKDSTLVINRGKENGLQVGDRVVASDYVLVGEVIDVFDQTSRVVLYTQTDQSQPGVLFPHDLPVDLIGYGGSNYYMDIDRAVAIEPGDVVYTSAPSGYLMAVVRDIQFDPRDPFKKVLLSPGSNIHELTYVQVLKNTTDNS